MNAPLVDAIKQLDLKPGETRTVEFDGRTVDLRERPADEASEFAGQVMIRPWFEMPSEPVGTVRAYPGQLPPPDPVIVPDDDGGEA